MKRALTVTLAFLLLGSSAAMARGYHPEKHGFYHRGYRYGGYYDGGDVGAALGAGPVGFGLGALAASEDGSYYAPAYAAPGYGYPGYGYPAEAPYLATYPATPYGYDAPYPYAAPDGYAEPASKTGIGILNF